MVGMWDRHVHKKQLKIIHHGFDVKRLLHINQAVVCLMYGSRDPIKDI